MNTPSAFTYEANKAAVILKAKKIADRQPVHLIFLIDISDSMSDGKLDSVKKSIEFLLPLLTPDDMVTLTTFGNSSDTVLLANYTTPDNVSSILKKVNELKTDGMTNMSSALMTVMNGMRDDPNYNGNPGHKTGVLLLTDGHANMGVSNSEGLQDIISRLMSENPLLSLTTVGYGKSHNAELLRQMATVGNGSYNVVYTLEDIATTFGEVLGGLTTVVAQNVTIRFPLSVELLCKYNHKKTSDHVFVHIGDLYSEQEVVVPYINAIEQAILITGSDMSDFSKISESLTPVPLTSDDSTMKKIKLAEFRYRVSDVLQSKNRAETESLLTELRALPFVSDNLVQMMIDDCERLLEIAEGIHHSEATIQQHVAYLGLGRGLRSNPIEEEEEDPRAFPNIRAAAASGLLRRTRSAAGGGGGSPPLAPASTSYGFGSASIPPPLTRRRTANVDTTSSPFSNSRQSEYCSIMRNASTQEH
jgi:Mg-chelatase subunit ChlD